MKKRKKINTILLGICAGIASYKSCELVRLLMKGNFSVKVMMTEAATRFVSPLVFQHLSGNPVYHDMFVLQRETSIQHVSLAQWADVCVIAPCSANTLAKIATGICDNLLTTVVCALGQKTPVIIAPAMNEAMWQNPIVQDKVRTLRRLKNYTVMNPAEGKLACGAYGQGRMPDPEVICKKVYLLI